MTMNDKSLEEVNEEQEKLLLAALKGVGAENSVDSVLLNDVRTPLLEGNKSKCLEKAFDIAREIGRLTDAITGDDAITVKRSLLTILSDTKHIAECAEIPFNELLDELRSNN